MIDLEEEGSVSLLLNFVNRWEAPFVAGVDPGLNGAFVFIHHTSVYYLRIPFYGEKPWEHFDAIRFLDLVYGICERYRKPATFFVERPLFLPGNHRLGQTGMRYGEILGTLQALSFLNLAYVRITNPKEWQQEILPESLLTPSKKGMSARVRKNELKNGIIKFAESTGVSVPTLTPRSKKKHDGVADAFCIALYGMKSLYNWYQIPKFSSSR